MTSKLPTDPLADASTGVVRRSRGASVKTCPGKPDRRDPNRRRKPTPGPSAARKKSAGREEPGSFGFPRWMVISAGVYLAALILAMILIFTY